MRKLFVFLSFGFAYTYSFSQVTLHEFILSATEDTEVQSIESQISYLETNPYKLSPLQKLELRTQNREMLSTQQQYGIRINPANPWEIQNTNKYFSAYKASLLLKKQRALKEALVNRYNLAILYFYYYETKQLTEENEKLIDAQLSILERQSASSFFDADEYVKLKVEQLNKQVESEEANFDWQSQKESILLMLPQSTAKQILWEPTSLITVDQVAKIADSLAAIHVASVEVAYRQEQIHVFQRQYDLEKSNINLGFLQTSYDRRRVNQDRNPFSISLGVTIPVTNPNKGDMARRKLSEIESEYELKSAQQEENGLRNQAYKKLQESILQYNQLSLKIEKLKKSTLPDQLTLLKGDDPLIRIQYETAVLKLRVLESKLKRKVYTYFIEYLTLSDHLQQPPLSNFLSRR